MKTGHPLHITVIAISCRPELGRINAPVFFEQPAERTAVLESQFCRYICNAAAGPAQQAL
jgi:hypothetical protein